MLENANVSGCHEEPEGVSNKCIRNIRWVAMLNDLFFIWLLVWVRKLGLRFIPLTYVWSCEYFILNEIWKWKRFADSIQSVNTSYKYVTNDRGSSRKLLLRHGCAINIRITSMTFTICRYLSIVWASLTLLHAVYLNILCICRFSHEHEHSKICNK